MPWNNIVLYRTFLYQSALKSISANPFLQNISQLNVKQTQLLLSSNQYITWQKDQYILHQ